MKQNIAISIMIFAAVGTIATINFLHAPFTHAQNSNSTSTNDIVKSDNVTTERTAMSTTDALPGHAAHQAIIVLPFRSDHKMWVGTLSWTSSKPIEMRLLYDYDNTVTTDASHGRPVTTALGFTQEQPPVPIGHVAISLIKPYNGPPTVSSFNSGTLAFVAKAVALHSVNGTKFTATYAVDATAKPMS